MRHARPEGLHHLQGALKTVRDAGLDVLCPQYRAAELQHFYRIQHESRTLSRGQGDSEVLTSPIPQRGSLDGPRPSSFARLGRWPDLESLM